MSESTGCVRESETKFEVEYLQEKLNFLRTFWYHWKALSKHNHNTNTISQLCYDMMYLCVNIWSYPIVYRAEFFVLIYLATLNLTKMPDLEEKFNFYVKINVL